MEFKVVQRALLITGLFLIGINMGCSARATTGMGPNCIFLAPGAGGDGPRETGLIEGLRRGGVGEQIHVLKWGAPLPLFFINLQNRGVHHEAEADLARRIEGWQEAYPQARICLIGHSAGCGVVLGALGQLKDSTHVEQVILLAPSVSPGYELGPALGHVEGKLHVFYSDHDNFWLSFRTGSFGTYDNIKSKAAGNVGFYSVERLPEELRHKVMQHPYEAAWRRLGNDGGHYGALARGFAEGVLAPLLRMIPPATEP